MAIFNKIRGGAGSNHYSGRMDYPHAGDGSSESTYTGDDFANEVMSAPKAGPAPKPAAFSQQPEGGEFGAGRAQRYNVHGGNGDYLRVTPTGDDKHNVSRYGSDHSLQYSTKNARFGHDSKTGTANWGGGTDHGGMGGNGNLKIADGPYTD